VQKAALAIGAADCVMAEVSELSELSELSQLSGGSRQSDAPANAAKFRGRALLIGLERNYTQG